MAIVAATPAAPSNAFSRGFGELAGVFRRIVANPAGAISLFLVVALVICAVFAPLIAPYNPIALAPRFLDSFLILICDAAKSLPMILFALAIVAIYGPSLVTLIGIIVFSMAPGYFRIVRNQALVLRNTDFVTAARAMGASPVRLALSHLLPNLVGPLLVLVAMDIPAVIGIESGLSFLGQGVQPPDPSWGTMLSDGYSFVRQAPHIAITAGIPIVIATIAFTFLGEAMRDALDPRSARAR